MSDTFHKKRNTLANERFFEAYLYTKPKAQLFLVSSL